MVVKPATIRIGKNFTAGNADRFKERVLKILDEGKTHLKIDLSNIQKIDAKGIAVLVATYKSCLASEKKMELVKLSPFMRTLLDITGLQQYFHHM